MMELDSGLVFVWICSRCGAEKKDTAAVACPCGGSWVGDYRRPSRINPPEDSE